MAENRFKLTILSPEKTLFSGSATQVVLPGSKAPFAVLYNHAPIISSLQRGIVRWVADETKELPILGGFVEAQNNEVTVCVETEKEFNEQ